MKKQKTQTKYGSVGGQALMEGIMMNGPEGKAMALRMPDGSISVEKKTFNSIKDKNKFFALPMIRGIVNFVEALIFGYKCLMESAEKTGMDLGEEEENMSKLDRWITDHFGEKMMNVIGAISMVLGFALAFALFVWMPSFLFDLINKWTDEHISMLRTIFEGLLRIIIFVVYMVAVSKMKEIKRVYMYHGAEHKSIFCYEKGLDLTVENVRAQSRLHPRCGTSFLLLVMIISILVYSVIPWDEASFAAIPVIGKALGAMPWVITRLILRLLLLPIVAGISYEIIKFAGRHDNAFTRAISKPGMLFQHITTNEPDDSQIEVAIAALKAVIPENKAEDEW